MKSHIRPTEESEELSVEDHWDMLRHTLTQAGEDHLGYARCKQPDWFMDNQDTLLPLFEERRQCYNRWVSSQLPADHGSFKTARSRVRAAVRSAKNNWLSAVARQAEHHRNSMSSWSAIRTIQRCFRGINHTTTPPLQNEAGQLCKTADEISARWKRHFTRILNVESTFDTSVFESLEVRPVRNDLADIPRLEELTQAIARLSNNKAAGASGILPEMVRHAGPAFLTSLLQLVRKSWSNGRVPQAWCDAEIVPVPKRGDLTSCDNWRGIALLDVVGKVVGRVIQSRLQILAETELADSQCGFRKGRSCTDHIFSVSQIVEKCIEHRTPSFLVFIDLRKAYDSVSRTALWRGLEILGVPPTLIKLLSSFHHGMSAKVRVAGSHTDSIQVNNFCTPSHNSSAPDVEFADDALLITPSCDMGYLALSTFVTVATSFGLTVNLLKTKVMPCGIGVSSSDYQPFLVNNQVVAFVDSFAYLGSLLSPDSRWGSEVVSSFLSSLAFCKAV